jgi:hypothetical protein
MFLIQCKHESKHKPARISNLIMAETKILGSIQKEYNLAANLEGSDWTCKVTKINETNAEATLVFYQAPASSTMYKVNCALLNNDWIVVSRKIIWIIN